MNELPSLYRCAAYWGIPFGLTLSIIAVGTIFSDKMALLPMLVMLLMLSLPWLLYRYQRRYMKLTAGQAPFAALWMLGIVVCLCGALIASLVAYCAIEFIRPDYLYEQAAQVIDAYGKVPQLANDQFIDVLKKAVAQNALPSHIDVVMGMFWACTALGSVTSAFTGALACRPVK